jgi:nucleoprotein TPR
VITNHLVLFRSLPALQAQNQKLLGIVREMGAKMEAEEREYRETLEKEQGEAVREAHEAITALQEQLDAQRQSHDVKMRAFVKERDSLKVLLARAERNNNTSSTAKDPYGGQPNANGGATDSELVQELAEIQQQFDAYRAETGVDSVRLREDTVSAQREVAQLNTQLAKANAKLEITGGTACISCELAGR